MVRSLILVVLLPSVAMASDELKKAQKQFDSVSYSKALMWAQRAARNPDNTAQDLVASYRLQGLSLAALGKSTASREAFSRLLAIDPSFRLEVGISPKLAAPFYQAVAIAKEHEPIRLMHLKPRPTERLGGTGLRVILGGDPWGMIDKVRLCFFTKDNRKVRKIATRVGGPGAITLILPGHIRADEIRYYFEATNEHGGVLHSLGGRRNPFSLRTGVAASATTRTVKPKAAPRVPAAKSLQDTPAPPSMSMQPAPPVEDTSWYETWWFWTLVGTVAAGAVTTLVLLSADPGPGVNADYDVRIFCGAGPCGGG